MLIAYEEDHEGRGVSLGGGLSDRGGHRAEDFRLELGHFDQMLVLMKSDQTKRMMLGTA